MRKVQELQEAVSQQEKQLVGLTGEAKEVRTGISTRVAAGKQRMLDSAGEFVRLPSNSPHASTPACTYAVLCPVFCCWQTKKAELEESQQQLAEAQAALTELQASFEQVGRVC
jgi:hypothetical protein